MNEPYDPSDKMNSDDFSNNSIPSEMEQRLMQCRPRTPQLDIEAILTMANNEGASKRITARVLERPSRITTSQLVSTIAASWVCGAVVGAASIFFSMSSERTPSQNPIASNTLNLASGLESSANTTMPTTETSPNSENLWQFDWNVEHLQVGMSLPFRSKLVLATSPHGDRLSDRTSSSFSDSLDYFLPPVPPMTQGELLKELSKDTGVRIH